MITHETKEKDVLEGVFYIYQQTIRQEDASLA